MAVWLLAPWVRAEQVSILFDAQRHAELARRISAEATSQGLSLVEVETAARPLVEVAQSSDAKAALRVRDADRVELFVAREDGTFRRWELRRGSNDDANFALLAVEQLRGALVEFELLPPSQVPPAASDGGLEVTSGGSAAGAATEGAAAWSVESSPPRAGSRLERPSASQGRAPDTRDIGDDDSSAAAPRTSEPPPLWALAGLGSTLAMGGAGVTPQADLGLRLEFPRWALTGRALLPLMENEFVEAGGEGEMSVNLFLLEQGTFLRWSPWSMEVGPGAGILVLAMQAESPDVGRTRNQAMAAAFLIHAGASWNANSWFRVSAKLRGGLASAQTRVYLDGRYAMAWGKLFASAAVTAEFAFPWWVEGAR